MNSKINFNVIEKTKSDNKDDIKIIITKIINNLIERRFNKL